mmetsp:Transcript_5994/g.19186  ORF Transcript_5994/g.19186 Transcript_5994/m.19186 type:complete len:226 (-) Transcript_5994:566-1243(-)
MAASARWSISAREPAEEMPLASHTASRARRLRARTASFCAASPGDLGAAAAAGAPAAAATPDPGATPIAASTASAASAEGASVGAASAEWAGAAGMLPPGAGGAATSAGGEAAAAGAGYIGSPSTSLESESDPQSAGGAPWAAAWPAASGAASPTGFGWSGEPCSRVRSSLVRKERGKTAHACQTYSTLTTCSFIVSLAIRESNRDRQPCRETKMLGRCRWNAAR